ncbi:hypothetical protein A9K55_001306 [Cordyceps militaris]|uniref:Uncharacterized protein n=1 Tax=Cordyceps militaris TaxID=73501 RepID=A0A2H4SS11_CORMI|nr:hypothetical protein A9K55_001306 [Cordyceps militaris]
MENKKPGPAVRGLVVQQHNRKPLFGNTRQTATAPAPAHETRIPPLSRSKSSPATHDIPGPASPATPGGSRIPRFGSRKALSLTEAFDRAAKEESNARPGQIDGSPSPAPRSWRKRQDDAMRMALNEDPLDKLAVSPNKERIAMRNRVDDGIAPTRTSRWVLEEGMRDADALLPSTENVAPGLEASPEKSYAWQVDEDFTAGDLQVSDSPRIRVNKPPFTKVARSESPRKGTTPNTKLDEIRARELGLTPNVASVRKSTKLDDIRLREEEADKRVPLLDSGFPRIGGFTKLDEIKQLEMQGLSKRAAAQAKLAEIQERNAMTRSVSPDFPRRNWPGRGADIPRAKSVFEPVGRQVPDTPVTIYKSEAERRADDAQRAAARKAEEKGKEKETKTKAANRGVNGLSPDKRDQSRELLRKLARAASASPAPERARDETHKNTSVPPKPEAPRSALADGSRRPSNTSSNASKSASLERPTVGFAGLARSRSSDSRKSKRSSVHSEQDPTDRIEAEERLFEAADNYSEYGSVRAPSPSADEEERNDNDATPKQPSKQDILSMPTPRAPGAFVDTPVTIKQEDRGGRRRLSLDQSPDIKPDLAFRNGKPDLARGSKDANTASAEKVKTVSDLALCSDDVETASDPGTTQEKPVRRRRLSLPRRQPLTNSAKLPSVRDDLREIQRAHNIRDGTLDNLEDILLGKKTTNEELDLLLQEYPVVADVGLKREPKGSVDEITLKTELQRNVDAALDDELAAYEALSASVERDLGVQKDGTIQTLPSQTSQTDKMQPIEAPPGQTNRPAEKTHPIEEKPRKNQKQPEDEDTKPTKQTTHLHIMDEKHNAATCPLCVIPAPRSITYLHLPLPRLFHVSPRPRLTLLGFLLCALAVWCAAETAMCALYCRPATCAGPCVWSFDDPAGFGAALPIKLDQWTTGGRGRAAWAALREDVLDGLDGLWGVGDVRDMTPAQRRRHRRRLGRGKGMSEEQRAKADAWRREREAGQRGGREEEAVGDDERVW